jgi:hypothetical protein
MERLENDIALLGRAIIFPQTPPLAARVRARIESRSTLREAAPRWQLALTGVAAAAVALAFIAGVLAPARDAVADIFDRINIFETDEVPQDLTRDITGTELSFDEVQAAVGFPLLLPHGASPDRVLLQDFGQIKAAVLFYRHDNGAPYALFETNSQVGKGLAIGKGVTDPGQAQPVSGLADEAYWLTGLRIVQYYDVDGAVLQGSVRATDVNTLLWNENGRVFRIEGDLTKDDAIAIADSLR